MLGKKPAWEVDTFKNHQGFSRAMLTAEHKEVLRQFGESGWIPFYMPCPGGCRFCYHRGFAELFPSVKIEHLPKYNQESFEYIYDLLKKGDQGALFKTIRTVREGDVRHGIACDYFSIGLTKENFEKLAKLNKGKDKQIVLYTTGINVAKEELAWLTKRCGSLVRVWLSVMTFNDRIKKQLVSNPVPSKKVMELLIVLKGPYPLLFHFNFKQTIADLKQLERLKLDDPQIVIMLLYYNRLHSEVVKQMADRARLDFKKLIFWLAKNSGSFKLLKNIEFQSPSCCYAWRYRNDIRRLLSDFTFTKDDLLMCSKGALEIMHFMLDKSVEIFPVPGSFGGSIDYTTGITGKDVIRELRTIIRRHRVKRVFLPDSIWWIEERYDLNAQTKDLLKKQFPDIEFVIIHIPIGVLNARLEIEHCYDYFNCDIKTTKMLQQNKELCLDAATQLKGDFGKVTAIGLIRELSIPINEDSERLLNSVDKNMFMRDGFHESFVFDHSLMEKVIDSDLKITVNYYEPVVQQTKDLINKMAAKANINGITRAIGRSVLNRLQLNNSSSKLFFKKVFIEGKEPDSIVPEVMAHFRMPESERKTVEEDILFFTQIFKSHETK